MKKMVISLLALGVILTSALGVQQKSLSVDEPVQHPIQPPMSNS